MGKVTRKELSQELEVGIREITRYKEDLESAGVTITNIKGKHGGYVLKNKDYLLNLELSKTEEESLTHAVDYIKNKNFIYFNNFKSAVDKIKAVNQEHKLEINKIEISDKTAKAKIIYEEERSKWLTINDGIINNKKILIKYQNANGTSTERIIHPYALFTYYEANYCLALCENRNDIRQFKVMRIVDIMLLNDNFEKIDIDTNDYINNTMGLFKDELINMKLKISYPYAKGFSEVRWINNEKLTDHIEKGYLIYEASAYGKVQIINWIMGMGSSCEVIEPKSLKEDIIKEYENILKNIYNRTI